ncbi:MAG: glucose-6-phosphate isomerase [Pirellulaceae bacterium]|nr:glucose-6-phosphate isomerase [Pirellulaceae bacterium]
MNQYPSLRFDYSGCLDANYGLTESQLTTARKELAGYRDEMLTTDLELFARGTDIPPEKIPLDAGFLELPDRLLDEYRTVRGLSELKSILATAKRLQESVDRVVVLGIGGSYMGARAILESCCDPFYNDLPRGERGGRPKIYFAGNNVDNDYTQGLLHLLRSTNATGDPQSKWGLVVISKSGGTLETAAALRQFIQEFVSSFGAETLPEFMIPVTGSSGKLSDLAAAIGCKVQFPVPDGVGGRFSIFSAVGLLPAAIMGADIIKLLEGASQMNDHFSRARPEENLVINFVAVNRLMELQRGCQTRVLSAWSSALEAAGLWYDQLLAESLGKHEQGALPLTVVNTRDLHSRAQQHQEGRRDKLMNNLVVDRYRHDSLAIGKIGWNQDGLDSYAELTLPQVMNAAIQGTNHSYAADQRPSTNLHLPTTDEASLGQFFQMMMLATVLEGRWMGVNPYGQPGVEGYKMHMKRFLESQ